MLRFLGYIIISTHLIGLFGPSADAAPLIPQALFKRCYAHVTGMVPTYEISNRLQIRLATISGDQNQRTDVINLCLELLNNTVIQANGTLAAPKAGSFFTAAEQTDLFLKTYLNFERLHSSWFKKSTYFMRDDARLTAFTIDHEAPPLYWNAATFIPGQKASSVVTTSNFYRPLRTPPPLFNSSMDYFKSVYSRDGFELGAVFGLVSNAVEFLGVDAKEPIRAQLVRRVGATIGLETVDPSIPYASFQTLINTNAVNSNLSINSDAAVTAHQATGYLLKAAGGGVLGSAPYMMMNLPTYVSAQDGGLKVARDWSTSVMSDFLCKSTPTLRYVDGSAAQQAQAPGRPPFRTAASCMACHASLDPLAYSIRNFQIAGIREINDTRTGGTDQQIIGTNFTDFLAQWPNNGTVITGLVDKNLSFHLSKPTGELLYRSFDGTKVSTLISTGVGGVGTAIAGTRDFYACMVSRYFSYLTGREVNLNDPVVSGVQPSIAQAGELNWVVTTGDNFKAGPQDIKTLWSTLLKSDWYQDATFKGAK